MQFKEERTYRVTTLVLFLICIFWVYQNLFIETTLNSLFNLLLSFLVFGNLLTYGIRPDGRLSEKEEKELYRLRDSYTLRAFMICLLSLTAIEVILSPVYPSFAPSCPAYGFFLIAFAEILHFLFHLYSVKTFHREAAPEKGNEY